jgi:hypothetical protein
MKSTFFYFVGSIILNLTSINAQENTESLTIKITKEGSTIIPFVTAKGGTGDKYELYCSANLDNWELLGTLFTCKVPITHVDTTAGGQTKRFYKIVKISYSELVTVGYYINPVPNGYLTQGSHSYNAVDFGAPFGTPIYAAASGKVVASKTDGLNGGYGLCVVISHGNETQTLYAHMSSNIVTIGQTVEQGDVIGYVGSTGLSTGPHLHFEVYGAKNPFTP